MSTGTWCWGAFLDARSKGSLDWASASAPIETSTLTGAVALLEAGRRRRRVSGERRGHPRGAADGRDRRHSPVGPVGARRRRRIRGRASAPGRSPGSGSGSARSRAWPLPPASRWWVSRRSTLSPGGCRSAPIRCVPSSTRERTRCTRRSTGRATGGSICWRPARAVAPATLAEELRATTGRARRLPGRWAGPLRAGPHGDPRDTRSPGAGRPPSAPRRSRSGSLGGGRWPAGRLRTRPGSSRSICARRKRSSRVSDGKLPPVRIERMRAADLEAVLQIERASFHTPWSRQAFLHELERNRVAALWVARAEGPGRRAVRRGCGLPVPLGGGRRGPRDESRGPPGVAWGRCWSASSSARSWRTIAHRCPARPSGGASGNVEARRLYEGLGFREVGRRRGYYVDTGEDALILEARLDEGPFAAASRHERAGWARNPSAG